MWHKLWLYEVKLDRNKLEWFHLFQLNVINHYFIKTLQVGRKYWNEISFEYVDQK